MPKKGKLKRRQAKKKSIDGTTGDVESRDVLLMAAIKLFAERGYDGTTTRDIAQVTGLNISLISYYFGGKEGLLEACLEYIQSMIKDEASAHLELADTEDQFHQKIKLFIKGFLGSHARHPSMHRVVQREFERDSAVFKKMVDKHYVNWYQKLTSFFADAQKKKWIDASLDPMTLAIALYGAMVQQVRLDRFRKDLVGISLANSTYFEKIVDDLVRLFSRGLLSP